MKYLLTLVEFLVLLLYYGVDANRVLLRDITSLTLHRGEYTTGRRSSPVPQLKCVGGTAHGKFSPKVVQCYNRGWDGRDVQWECKAEMPLDYQFGKIEVSCEGYDYPNDPFVLAGSCGLNYELDYSSDAVKRHAYIKPTERSIYESIAFVLFLVFVASLIYLIISQSGSRSSTGTIGGSNTDGRGPGPDGRRPPPPGWSPPPSGPPPPYDDTFGGTSSSKPTTSGSSSGPGFYTGMGLGALGGYLFGRSGQRDGYGYGYGGNEYRYRGRSRYGNDEYTGYDGSAPSTSSDHHHSPSSSTTHSSSGFGGTSRR